MFKQYDNPDYYNDAVRDARVNNENVENHSNSKGKLLLISNLLLISTILGYFIYQKVKPAPETVVMGVNYTVDIHEEKNKETTSPITTEPTTSKEKSTETSRLKSLVENSTEKNSAYIQALGDELTGIESKKVETPHHNKELENILADIDAQEFRETTNVVKIQNKPKATEELDVDELANVINALVSEELPQTKSKILSYEEQLAKAIPIN